MTQNGPIVTQISILIALIYAIVPDYKTGCHLISCYMYQVVHKKVVT